MRAMIMAVMVLVLMAGMASAEKINNARTWSATPYGSTSAHANPYFEQPIGRQKITEGNLYRMGEITPQPRAILLAERSTIKAVVHGISFTLDIMKVDAGNKTVWYKITHVDGNSITRVQQDFLAQGETMPISLGSGRSHDMELMLNTIYQGRFADMVMTASSEAIEVKQLDEPQGKVTAEIAPPRPKQKGINILGIAVVVMFAIIGIVLYLTKKGGKKDGKKRSGDAQVL
jgi:hypothetical protein